MRRHQEEAEHEEVERKKRAFLRSSAAGLLSAAPQQIHSSTGTSETDGCNRSCQSLTGMHELVMHALNITVYLLLGTCSILNN